MPEQLERTSIGAVRPRPREDIGAYLPSVAVQEGTLQQAGYADLTVQQGRGTHQIDHIVYGRERLFMLETNIICLVAYFKR